MNKLIIPLLAAATLVSACAKKSSDISASYVSTMQYQGHSCRQISVEAQAVSARASQVMTSQDKKAQNDTAAMAVGMVLFWPALFFLKGDSETSAEVARLKGEMDALEKASIQKNCGITFQRGSGAA